MTSVKWRVVGAVVIGVLFANGTPRAQSRQPSRIALLEQWIAAVNDHRPGTRDAALESVAGLAWASRQPLQDIAWKFTGFLRDPNGRDRRPLRLQAPPEMDRARLLAVAELKRRPANEWLHRAAVFEADAMMLASDLTNRATAETARGAGGSGLVNGSDGEFKSTSERNWNLAFGRKLLEDVAPAPENDDFVGAWYHATSAFLFARGSLGELRPHLEAAERARPWDRWILFDLGTLFDDFTRPAVQAVIMTAKLPADIRPDVPPVADSRKLALGYFARVIDAGPEFAEARVRYARLLTDVGRLDEAVTQCDLAVSTSGDPVVQYFGHLFAVRAEQKRGRVAEAVARATAAVALFPSAQSAHLALSQSRLLLGDTRLAQVAIEALGRSGANGQRAQGGDPSDPMWNYNVGAGRWEHQLTDAVWALIK